MPTDLELLDAWAEGDRESAQTLLARHFEGITRFFRTKVDQDVEDLVHRSFLACLDGRRKLREGSSFRAYLYTVARHELFAWFRSRRKASKELELGEVSLVDLGTSPSKAVAREQEQLLLLEGLRRIPLDLQIAVELHYWEQLSTAELAEVLGIPRGTVKSRLHRAREALRSAIEQVADSPELLEATMTKLDDWARSIRDCV